MRLYLSSYRLGNQPEKLVALVGSDKRAALILNARDNYPDKRVADQTDLLATLGLTASELDLRAFIGKQEELGEALSQYGVVWIPGGNSFLLRRAMYDSGFDGVIKHLLEQDRIVYAGYSAAVVVLAPTLRGIELVDDVNAVQTVYQADPIWEGLGILPYSVAVHYQSNHPESAATDKEVEFYAKEGMAFRPLKDGQAIVINGNQEEIAG